MQPFMQDSSVILAQLRLLENIHALLLVMSHDLRSAVAILLTTQEKYKEILQVDLSQITQAVQNNTSVTQSAITLIQQIAQQLSQAKTDPAAIQQLADQLNSSAASLASAVVANTPSEGTA